MLQVSILFNEEKLEVWPLRSRNKNILSALLFKIVLKIIAM